MKHLRLSTLIVMTVFIFSCAKEKKNSYPAIEQTVLEKHMEKLASDEFLGRMPCTEGENKTIAYLESEMKRIGLKPANGGSYLQDVPLVDISGAMSSEMVVTTPSKKFQLQKGTDFVVHSERTQERLTLTDSELVFCGFGIQSEKEGWDDYAGMDMTGKTAVILINDPGFGGEDSTFFKGNAMTYNGRWDRKYDVADAMGADGLIIIHETASAGYPWFVVQSSWTGSMQGLDGVDRSSDTGIKGWWTLDAAKNIFEACDLNLGEQIRAARKPGFKPVPLNAQVNVSLENTYSSCTSHNVAGYIEGKTKPEEYVVYTAHWDHIGVGNAVDGDSIYNGALDNASGTATVLAIAESMAKSTPDRSVVFLFVTAEEQGLLGSEYYVENPLFPLDATVANLNMDGVNPAGRMKDFTITGKGHSEMDEWAQKAAEAQGRYVQNEKEPEKGYFFRSDQFNFARKGVPVLYADGGYDHWEKGKEYALKFREEYTAQRYHAPADNYDPEEWNYEGMVQDGQIYLNIGFDLSNSSVWPEWYAQSEFSRPKVMD
ncbi:MAG: M28 family metallopeptidase [Saprospiraceae bacterium]|nr:M28 family metallopeptidase [Saprospiraceae bacterium]